MSTKCEITTLHSSLEQPHTLCILSFESTISTVDPTASHAIQTRKETNIPQVQPTTSCVAVSASIFRRQGPKRSDVQQNIDPNFHMFMTLDLPKRCLSLQAGPGQS
jgi:hypothetical protein